MQITDIAKIPATVTEIAKTGNIISNTTQGTDWINTIEKVTKLFEQVNKIVGTFQQQQQTRTNQQIDYLQQMPEHVSQPVSTNKTETKNMNGFNIIKLLFPTIENDLVQYIDKCYKNNPDMSLGEALKGIDFITVKQLKNILDMVNKK
jgi:hypothetical protein